MANGMGRASYQGWDEGKRPSLLEKNELWAERKISNYPHLCSTTWEGWDEAISCLSTGTTKSLYASVFYFPFWHHQSSQLSRHDQIWQVPRTLAKLDRKETVICGGGWAFCLPLRYPSWVCCLERLVVLLKTIYGKVGQLQKGWRTAKGLSLKRGLWDS